MNTQSQQSSHNHGNHDVRVGERVLLLMFRARITQTALARKLGMTQAGLSKKIHGERKWTLDDLYAIAAALGVTINDLLGENEKRPPIKGDRKMNLQTLDYRAAGTAEVIHMPVRGNTDFASTLQKQPARLVHFNF